MKTSPYLVLALLVSTSFTVATTLQPRAAGWAEQKTDSVLKLLLGDGRRIFANQFFVQADVSFHRGYYPSIFDQAAKPKESPMISGDAEHAAHSETEGGGHAPVHVESGASASDHEESEHEKEMAFFKEPQDWVERFGRQFLITEHSHLSGGSEREILPWLKLSAEMDPQRIATYTVSAYWLRRGLGKVKEAEDFLHDGLRNNPESYEILFELGRLYRENLHDDTHARNVWEVALKKWTDQQADKPDPDLTTLEQLTLNLGRMEEEQGNLPAAIHYLELARKASPHPDELEKQIQELRVKTATKSN